MGELSSAPGSERSPGEGNGHPPHFLSGKSHGQRNLVGLHVVNKGLISKIQIAHASQYQKNKQPNQKMGIRPKQIFLQRKNKHGQKVNEKMLK